MKFLLFGTLFVIFISFIVLWYRNRIITKSFRYAGLYLTGVILSLQLIAVAVTLDSFDATTFFTVLFSVPITAIELYAYTVVGLVFAFTLNNIPLSKLAYKPSSGYQTLDRIFPLEVSRLLITLSVVVVLVLFSVVLIWLSDAKASDTITNLLSESFPVETETGNTVKQTNYRMLYMVVIAAISEEIIFRLALQNWLSVLLRNKIFAEFFAIIASTFIWMIAHVGMLEPEWVKMLQIFVMGITLGVMNRRFGIQYCIIAHVIFNLAMFPIGQRLL